MCVCACVRACVCMRVFLCVCVSVCKEQLERRVREEEEKVKGVAVSGGYSLGMSGGCSLQNAPARAQAHRHGGKSVAVEMQTEARKRHWRKAASPRRMTVLSH